MISTKGRYALRVMLDLAANQGEAGFLPLKDIARRQRISEKYLECILKGLVQEKLLIGVRGKGGGYRLVKKPEEYTVGSILRLTEGELAPVSCLEKGADPCPQADVCLTLPMWTRLDAMIQTFFDGVTLADLMEGK
ncbi:MAG: Rrf2 family transcriptional regulator [Clostridiales bacterium]|nr:Rrf2 family transcriptional regulator [Clostridiales bacterium]